MTAPRRQRRRRDREQQRVGAGGRPGGGGAVEPTQMVCVPPLVTTNGSVGSQIGWAEPISVDSVPGAYTSYLRPSTHPSCGVMTTVAPAGASNVQRSMAPATSMVPAAAPPDVDDTAAVGTDAGDQDEYGPVPPVVALHDQVVATVGRDRHPTPVLAGRRCRSRAAGRPTASCSWYFDRRRSGRTRADAVEVQQVAGVQVVGVHVACAGLVDRAGHRLRRRRRAATRSARIGRTVRSYGPVTPFELTTTVYVPSATAREAIGGLAAAVAEPRHQLVGRAADLVSEASGCTAGSADT